MYEMSNHSQFWPRIVFVIALLNLSLCSTQTVRMVEDQNKHNREEESMPYSQEEVKFVNSNVTLAGTLTLPKKSGRHPAVVMLHGSGPVNRDHEAFGIKFFQIIADHFTRKGIAVLRYDSRGVGGSMGKVFQYTISDVSGDALAAVRYLKTRDDINHAQIGLCGHSQGGIVAPLAATRSEDVAFIICISGIGSTGEESFYAQNEAVARAEGATEEEIIENSRTLEMFISFVREGASDSEMRPVIIRMVRNQMALTSRNGKREAGGTEKEIETKISCVLTTYNTPWFRSFLDYDAKQVLARVKCPVLLLFGELDLQVPAEMHSRAMVSALERAGNDDYVMKIFPKANHLFLHARTGSPSEYGDLAKEFVPGFLEFMSDWILEHVDIVE